MRTVSKYAGMTAKQIIDGQDGETNGGMRMTGNVIWNYRTEYNPDGTYDALNGPCVCEPEQASCSVIESLGGIGPMLALEC